MITPELITYIKKQLESGIAKDQISQTLVTSGWNPADVAEGFNTLKPAQQPMTPQPTIIQPIINPTQSQPTLSQPIQPIINTAIISEGVHPFRNPSTFVSFIMAIIAIVVGCVFMYLRAPALSIAAIGATLIAMEAGILLVGLLLGSVIINITTRVLKIPGARFGKSVVFVAMQMIVSFVFALLASRGIPVIAILILEIIAWIILFYVYYQASILKSIGAFLLDIIFSVILGIIIFAITFFAGIGFAKILFNQAFNTTSSHPITQTMPSNISINQNIHVIPASAPGATLPQQPVAAPTSPITSMPLTGVYAGWNSYVFYQGKETFTFNYPADWTISIATLQGAVQTGTNDKIFTIAPNGNTDPKRIIYLGIPYSGAANPNTIYEIRRNTVDANTSLDLSIDNNATLADKRIYLKILQSVQPAGTWGKVQ